MDQLARQQRGPASSWSWGSVIFCQPRQQITHDPGPESRVPDTCWTQARMSNCVVEYLLLFAGLDSDVPRFPSTQSQNLLFGHSFSFKGGQPSIALLF